MRVSILMPVKNAVKWLPDTIASILNQTFRDWELIAVDDGSTDDSIALISAFNDPRICVIQNEGTGIIPALQTGLKRAQGIYITRMDADDRMPVEKLARLTELLKGTEKRTIATGLVQYFSDSVVSEGYQKYAFWLNERCLHGDHYDHIFRECVIASPNWMAHRETLIEDRIFEVLNYPEDYDMVFHWRTKGYRIIASSEITHFWREHAERTSRNSEIYDQDSFFRLKLAWFRKTELQQHSLAVFGAGPKGKAVVRNLAGFASIQWYDLQHERYNTGIMGFEILPPETCREDLLLVAVYPEKREPLEAYLLQLGYQIGKNAWYV